MNRKLTDKESGKNNLLKTALPALLIFLLLFSACAKEPEDEQKDRSERAEDTPKVDLGVQKQAQLNKAADPCAGEAGVGDIIDAQLRHRPSNVGTEYAYTYKVLGCQNDIAYTAKLKGTGGELKLEEGTTKKGIPQSFSRTAISSQKFEQLCFSYSEKEQCFQGEEGTVTQAGSGDAGLNEAGSPTT